MAGPEQTPEQQASRSTFLALMNALSHPGRRHALAEQVTNRQAMQMVGQTLLDLETTFATDDPWLLEQLQRTGAYATEAARADYVFSPRLREQDLPSVAQARVGTLLAPDTSATLILGCAFDEGLSLRLRGPGIGAQPPHRGEVRVRLEGIPLAFWQVRNQHTYPLGWDLFLVNGGEIMGLPRTTQVEVSVAAGSS